MTADTRETVPPPASYWRELVAYRGLLWTLALREIRVRYKQAVLGAAWAVLQPVLLMVVFTLFFSKLLHVPSDGIPYPLFVFSALLPWTFFANSLASAIPSLTNTAHLITKVYFPREVLPLASVLAAGFDFCIAGIVFLGMLLFYDVNLTVGLLWLLPLLVIQVGFTAGIVLLLAALNVSYRDVRHAVPLLVQLLMFATPVIYPVSVVPERFRFWYLLNPMGGLIEGYRRVVLHGVPPEFFGLGLAALVSLLLLVAGYSYFRRVEGEFADVI